MGAKLRNLALFLAIGGLAAVVAAPPAHANRGNNPTTTTTQGYVPPPPQVDQNPEVIPDAEPSAPIPVVEPTVVPVDLPVVTDPGAGLAGDGDPLAPAPSADSPQVLDKSETRNSEPAPSDGFMGGILSRTGSETLPLARAGLAALALGLGLVVLGRRRRVDAAAV